MLLGGQAEQPGDTGQRRVEPPLPYIPIHILKTESQLGLTGSNYQEKLDSDPAKNWYQIHSGNILETYLSIVINYLYKLLKTIENS